MLLKIIRLEVLNLYDKSNFFGRVSRENIFFFFF